ncbi:MAG: hypothetical protein WAN35_17435 [Terracidiphilus sp.]
MQVSFHFFRIYQLFALFMFITLTLSLPSMDYGQKVNSSPERNHIALIEPGLNYTQHTEPHHRVTLPRLTQFPDAAVMKLVNDDLSFEERQLRIKASNCLSSAPHHSFWEQKSRVSVLTHDVFSIESEAFVYCGGPHPDEQYFPLTYNMQTGKRFDFARDAATLFKSEILPANDLIEIYKRHYPAEMSDCNISFIDSNAGLILNFAPRGLEITLDLPHVIAACGPEIVVPYREILPLVKNDNPFRSLIKP